MLTSKSLPQSEQVIGPEASTLVEARMIDAERSDPHGERWRRSKQHDDKALAAVQFATNSVET